MPWKPLASVAFGVVVFPFTATEPDDLPLQIGDHVYIIEQGGRTDEWYRGYLVAPPSLLAGLTIDRGQQLEHRVFSGIFPANCVEVREYLGESQDAAPDADDEDASSHHLADERSRRKSEIMQARRMSRISKKKSMRAGKKERKSVLIPQDPAPRPSDAAKPLAPVPLLRVGDESGLSAFEPLVDEISSCLREWHDARLHELILARGYHQLAKVEALVKRVDHARSQLMHDVLTQRELTELREDTVWDLVAGNKMLSDEVIVRSPTEKGRILTADDSVVEMTKLQANMSILDRPPKPASDKHMLHHLLVDARNLVIDADQPGTLHMCLFAKEQGEKPVPLSENYAISVPVPDTQPTHSEELPKTLFVNLSNGDLGIGGANRSLYVVFKLLRDEPIRHTVYGQGINHTQKPSLLNSAVQASSGFSSAKGRLSVFGSQRKKTEYGRGQTSSERERPTTSQSQRSDKSKTPSDPPATRDVKMVRRCAGVGALDITQLARAGTSAETSVALWTPSTSTDAKSDMSEDWMDITRDLLRSATGTYTRVSIIRRLDVFVKAFATANLEGLVRNTPTLLHNILMTPKLGFSGVPSEKRSDIYLTLTEPRMPRNATLAHSKFGAVPLNQRAQTSMANLQLTLEVRNAAGERIEDSIFTSSNHQGHTAWRTTGVERGEGWNQTIRLAIPAQDVPGSHVVMSIADAPNFPFALAWVPLWEFDAFVRDGEHQVSLYVYDEYSSSIIGGRGAYLALPPWHDKNDQLHANAATITLKTFLSSTEYSQDPTLLGVLHWRNYHGEQLLELLDRFSFVPEIEIVKLLSDVFSALFEILHEYEDVEEYEDLVFYNFIIILEICRDKRFELGNIIETYATTRRDWPRACTSLVRAYHRLVSRHMDADASRKLRASFKVGDRMLKLIVESMKAGQQTHPTEDEEDEDEDDSMPLKRQDLLKGELHRLFVAVMALLRNPMPVLLGTQTLVIQRFHSWLPELTPIMSPPEILEIATDLLDSCAHARGKMSLYRLILMVNYSHLDVFKAPEVRTTLIANTFRWLEPYWGWVPEPDQQWRDQVRLCCSVVAAQTEALGEESCQYVPKLAESFAVLRDQPRQPRRVFSMLFPTTYPFPTKPTNEDIDVDEAMLEIAALLAAALTTEQKLYFDPNVVDIPNVLTQALEVGHAVLSGQAFPRSWLSLLVSHHRYGMTSLERINEVLIEGLPDIYAPDANEAFDFDTNIWRQYFNTLFAALGSPVLAMETFPEQKRRAVWKIAGDVRELGANLLRRSWEAIGWETDDQTERLHGFKRMGGYQVQFVPEMVGPIVELCLSVHASLRSVAIEVLRSMMISAWQLDQDLSIIQTAMIDCLDKLCRNKNVTETVLQKTFVPEMLEQFKSLEGTAETELHKAVVDMFGKIQDLLVMLASVHSANPAVNDASRLVDTLHLMEFLREAQSEDAYIRYVHQLADMQLASGNITEAGLALKMHADRYAWDPNENVTEMQDPAMPAQTAFDRKESLYFHICKYFERGKAWKRALVAYRDLAEQYEHNVFDFAKLARTQRAIAAIHERVARGERVNPRYFRVAYRGLGFPQSLRDKQFIFEGSPTDRLSMFEDRMQQIHPTAQILRGGQDAGIEGQYLQIYAVSPNKDLENMVYQRTKVSQAVREYNLISNPKRFATTSRQPAHDIPITEQVVEKVIYTTAEEFPTILRRSEIVNIETVTLLPIEAAIERTTRKTQELLAMEKRIAGGDDDGALNRLTEDMLSSVDAESEGSVARYRGLLPAHSDTASVSASIEPSVYGRSSVDHESPAFDPMQNALRVALLDHTLALRRCLGLFTRPHMLATRAELVSRFEATFQHELNILFPLRDRLIEDVSPRPSIEQELAAAAQETEFVNAGVVAAANHAAAVAGGPADPDSSKGPGAALGGGAGAGDASSPGAGADSDGLRGMRRRSIPFLRRAISRQGRSATETPTLGGVNGGDGGRDEGGGGRTRSRAGSRVGTRDRSLSRLSFFQTANDRTTPGAERLHTSAGTPMKERRHSLKQRLSFFGD